MNLKSFDTTNSETQRIGTPKIRISANAASSINSQAGEALKVKQGDRITFHQDEDNPEDWFMEIGSKTGFPLRKPTTASNAKNKLLVFNASSACRKIIESIGLKDTKSISCLITIEPIKVDKKYLYPIITSSAKNQED